MNLRTLSVIGYLIAVVALVFLIFRQSLFADTPVAIVIQVGAVALMIWARMTFGGRSFHLAANPTQGGLVTVGPYRYLRHPIYAAVLYFLWAGVLCHLTPTDAIIGLVATGGLALRIVSEERLVTGQYPEYREYAARTKRVIPFLL